MQFRPGQRPSALETFEIIEDMEHINLQHPVSGQAFILDLKEAQFRRPAQLNEIASLWEDGVSLQLWLNADCDVVLSTRVNRNGLTFHLDGLTLAQSRFLAASLLLKAMSHEACQALLADRDLEDSAEIWMDYFSGDGNNVPYEADLLMLKNGRDSCVTRRQDSWLC